MFDYIGAIYHGDPIHTPAPNPLDDRNGALRRRLERVRQEMGDSFAGELETALRMEFNGSRKWAFLRGFRLGGQFMLAVVDGGGD